MPKAAKAKANESAKDKIEKIMADIEALREKFVTALATKTQEFEKLQREYVRGLQGEGMHYAADSPNAAVRPARAAPRVPGQAAKPASKRGPGRGSGRGSIDEGAILAVVRENPGIAMGEIHERAKVTATYNSLSVRLRKMVDDGKLKKSGDRGQARYWVK